MFPEFEINIEEIGAANRSDLGRCFLFDFKNNRHVIRDGKLVECTKQEAVKQWVNLILKTSIDKYKIYQDSWFGLSYESFIGNKTFPLVMLQAELEMEIKEKLLNHVLINSITEFKIERLDYGLSISFKVGMIDGSSQGVNIDVTR